MLYFTGVACYLVDQATLGCHPSLWVLADPSLRPSDPVRLFDLQIGVNVNFLVHFLDLKSTAVRTANEK